MTTALARNDDADALRAARELPPDLMLMRMENEQIMSVATSAPRDFVAIREELLSELAAYPQAAAASIYQKPVGRDGNQQMQYARGLSIRAAENMAVAFGFNRVSCNVEELGDDKVKITATFVDYAKGRMWQDAEIVSKFYKSKSGRMTKHNDDRFYNVVVNAAKSKRIREVILRCVPANLKAAYTDACEKAIDELLDDRTVEKMIGAFASKGVTREHLEDRIIGKPLKLGWTMQDRRQLQGIWNALEGEETTIEELLGDAAPKAKPPTSKPPADEQVSASDLTGNGKAKSDEPQGSSGVASDSPNADAFARYQELLGRAASAKIARGVWEQAFGGERSEEFAGVEWAKEERAAGQAAYEDHKEELAAASA